MRSEKEQGTRKCPLILKVDVSSLEEEGDFLCPKCACMQLVIRCANCKSEIQLIGFLKFTQPCSCDAEKPVLFWIVRAHLQRNIDPQAVDAYKARGLRECTVDRSLNFIN